MKKILLAASGVLLLVLIGVVIWSVNKPQEITSPTQDTKQEETSSTDVQSDFVFENPKKSAHYESNTPAHGSILAGVPINIVIDFNFDLAKPSEIQILKDGVDFGLGETIIDTSKLTLRRSVNKDAADGLYTVKYKACWPDGSCHDGSFQFAIDSISARSYIDETGKKEVTISLSSLKFDPQNIRISKGTKVTWVNNEEVEHYINTDSHPAHTYFLAQNSKALKKGESFSLVFDQIGIYPYHCSVHPSSMTGNLLVE